MESSTTPGVARGDNGGWSLYGAPWSQPVATGRKSDPLENGKNKRKALQPAATGCLRSSMVSRASAVGCHPLREVPSLRGRGSTPIRDGWLFLTAAVRARALVATAAGACLADHAEILSRAPALVEVTAATTVITNPTDLEDHGRAKADAAEGQPQQSNRSRALTRPYLHKLSESGF